MTIEQKKQYQKEYRLAHLETAKEYAHQYRTAHKEERGKYQLEYRLSHKKESAEYRKQYVGKNKDLIKQKMKNLYPKYKSKIKEYSEKNKEKLKEGHKIWILKNKDKIKETTKIYLLNNKDIINKQRRDRKATNILYRMSSNLRSRTSSAFKYISANKPTNTKLLLGADYATIKSHIEKQFVEGMRWENYGFKTWHIDHIIPMASAKDTNGLLLLCHYTNLQPLWAKENISKGSKIIKSAI